MQTNTETMEDDEQRDSARSTAGQQAAENPATAALVTQDWRDTDPAARKRQRGNKGRREQVGEKRVRHFTREPEEGRRVSPRFADERAEVATAGDEGRARADETENAGGGGARVWGPREQCA